jgi:hypothetical protein
MDEMVSSGVQEGSEVKSSCRIPPDTKAPALPRAVFCHEPTRKTAFSRARLRNRTLRVLFDRFCPESLERLSSFAITRGVRGHARRRKAPTVEVRMGYESESHPKFRYGYELKVLSEQKSRPTHQRSKSSLQSRDGQNRAVR